MALNVGSRRKLIQTSLLLFNCGAIADFFRLVGLTNVQNQWVLEKIGPCRRILDKINERKLKFLGHITRTSGITKDLLFGTVIGKRGRGRPKTRLSDNVKNIAIISMASLLEQAQDRNQWRSIVESVTAGQ